MEILNALGVNETVLIQFGVFLVAYIFLTQILFGPYFKAFIQRKERTVGKADQAERFIQETKDLQTKFETRAREINSRYKVIYDESRTQALREHDHIVNEARQKAKSIVETQREILVAELSRAKRALADEIPDVSAAIQARLLGREKSL